MEQQFVDVSQFLRALKINFIYKENAAPYKIVLQAADRARMSHYALQQ